MKLYRAGAACVLVLSFCMFQAACRQKPAEVESTPAPAKEVVELRIASFGGSFQEALDKAVVQPTSKSAGTRAKVETYSGEYDRLAATIRNGTNTLDLVHVESSFLRLGAREKLTAPIDWKIVNRDKFVAGATDTNGVALLAWSLVLAWNDSRLPKGTALPGTWEDLFSLDRYPGPRCLRKTPEGNLEAALLADGVAPADLYRNGLDVDRALNKLAEIKPYITWWSSGAELEQKLTSSCSLAAAWNGRVLNLKNTAGEPVSLTYNQAIHQYDWWVVPANSGHKEASMRFLNAFGEGIGQINIARQFGYGPVSRRVVEALTPDLLATMPTSRENVAKGIPFNAQWWADNQGAVQEKWNAWLLER